MLRTIVKRLAILPITVLGVTLLVFMLVAASPGGLSGDEEPSGEMEAYIEDRYGLGDPVLVQYGRWLARLSPVRFGAQEQVDRDGRVVRVPRPVRPPPVWRWYADALPAIDGADPFGKPSATAQGSIETRERRFREALRAHEAARWLYLRARAEAMIAARACVIADGRPDPGRRAGDADFGDSPARRDSREWAALEVRGREALARFADAERTRHDLRLALEARPLPAAGLRLIPGTVWLARPDLGDSLAQRRPVTDLIAEALPITLLLNAAAIPLTYLIAIPGGVLAAVRRGSWIDTGIGVLFTALWSIPTAWAAVMAIGFLAGAPPRGLGWFPVSGLHGREAESMAFLPGMVERSGAGSAFERGYLLDTLWHMVLPVLCLAYGSLAVLAKQARSATLENLSSDFVRTARAKGCDESAVLTRHVLRPGMLPLITLFVGVFPAMISGSVIVERAFGVPGMGSLVVDSFLRKDAEVLLASTTMMAVVNILALLLGDVLYALADPRVRAGAGAGGRA